HDALPISTNSTRIGSASAGGDGDWARAASGARASSNMERDSRTTLANLGMAHLRARSGQQFPRVENTARIEQRLEPAHQGQRAGVQRAVHEPALGQADPVLAGERPAQ